MVEMYDLKVRLFPRERESLTCTYVVGLPTWSQPQLTQRCTYACVHTGLAAHALRGPGGAGHGQGLGAEGPQLLQPPRGHRQVRLSASCFCLCLLVGVLAAGLVRTMAQPNHHPLLPNPTATATPSSPSRAPAGASTWGPSARSSSLPTSSPTSSGFARCAVRCFACGVSSCRAPLPCSSVELTHHVHTHTHEHGSTTSWTTPSSSPSASRSPPTASSPPPPPNPRPLMMAYHPPPPQKVRNRNTEQCLIPPKNAPRPKKCLPPSSSRRHPPRGRARRGGEQVAVGVEHGPGRGAGDERGLHPARRGLLHGRHRHPPGALLGLWWCVV